MKRPATLAVILLAALHTSAAISMVCNVVESGSDSVTITTVASDGYADYSLRITVCTSAADIQTVASSGTGIHTFTCHQFVPDVAFTVQFIKPNVIFLDNNDDAASYTATCTANAEATILKSHTVDPLEADFTFTDEIEAAITNSVTPGTSVIGDTVTVTVTLDSEFQALYVVSIKELSVNDYLIITNGCPNTGEAFYASANDPTGQASTSASTTYTDFMLAASIPSQNMAITGTAKICRSSTSTHCQLPCAGKRRRRQDEEDTDLLAHFNAQHMTFRSKGMVVCLTAVTRMFVKLRKSQKLHTSDKSAFAYSNKSFKK